MVATWRGRPRASWSISAPGPRTASSSRRWWLAGDGGVVRLSLRAIVVALVIAAAGSALAQETPAVRTLATYGPDILWQPESELSGDIDCDGRPDQALLGRRDDRVYVGVVV